MDNQESTKRDSYGKIDYINVPYLNTGSVSQVSCGTSKSKNPKLRKSLKKTSDFLDKMFEKYNVKEKLAKKDF